MRNGSMVHKKDSSVYQLDLTQIRKWFDKAKIIFGYQFIKESRHTRLFNNLIENRNEQSNIYTSTPTLKKRNLKIHLDMDLTFGITEYVPTLMSKILEPLTKLL